MGSTGVPTITIHPDERFGQAYRYTPGTNMPSGSNLVSATVAALDVETGDDTTADVLTSAVGLIGTLGDDQIVTASLKGGGSAFDGTRHKVTITTTLDTGEIYVDVFFLVVDDRVRED